MTDSKIPANSEVVAEQENVDRIRDILFGGRMREYERRFGELEKRFSEDNRHLREALEHRLDKLETIVKSELERLIDKQVSERKERLRAIGELNTLLTTLEQHLGDRLESVEEQGAQERLTLRSELLEQSQQLADTIRTHSEQLRASLDKEIHRLQSEKTGRDELSRLMTELGMRLSGEFQLPEH